MIKTNLYLKDSQGWNPQMNKKQPPKEKTDHITPIILHVHYRGNRVRIYIDKFSKPSNWDFASQRFKSNKSVPNAIRLNERLNNVISTAEAVYLDYQRNNDNKIPPPDKYRELVLIALKLKDDPRKDLFTFFEQIIQRKLDDAGDKPLRNTDIPSYQYTLEALKQYAKKKRKRVDFDTISLDFYHDWKRFMFDDLKLKTNTVGIRIRRLKSVLIRATAAGLTTNLIHQDPAFKTISEETQNIYLSESELAKLSALELNNESEVVRDLFLVLAWTGIRESDLKQVKRSNINNDYLQIKQQKTGGRISIPLHPVVIEVLKKYDYELPLRSQQHINRELKKIGAKLAGEIKLSEKDYSQIKSHTGRRSFATNMINRRISAREIMLVTGHRTEKDFYRYLQMAPVELNSQISLSFKKDVRLRKAE